jgi:large repetitive protein
MPSPARRPTGKISAPNLALVLSGISATGPAVSIQAAASGQYVRLRDLAAADSNPWTSAAEIDLLDENGALIPHSGWSVQAVDSEETVRENDPSSNAIDGNPSTFWHTQWFQSSPLHPHEIQINLGSTKTITGFPYLPTRRLLQWLDRTIRVLRRR